MSFVATQAGPIREALLVAALADAELACLWEGAWWKTRRDFRRAEYQRARAHARRLGKPLVVIGAPDRGATGGYPCGDITIDIQASRCPNSMQADITRRIPLPDDCCVVFESCVLECVSDPAAALREMARIAGGRLHMVRVEPWTLTALFYPGAQWLWNARAA